MRVVLLFCLVFVMSCGRPLTDNEKRFAEQIHGESIDTSRIRFVNGALIGKVTYKRQKRPRLACRERIFPEPTTETVTVGPAAFVLFNKVFYSKEWYDRDYLPVYPERMSLVHAMIFAHEITHVWQWQNRAKTGYTPLKAASEHAAKDDPYLFDISTKTRFLDYAYEQQASIVEEYVCCAALDPTAPRTKRLKELLRDGFPLQELRIPNEVVLPWDGAEVKGICRV
ncbi:hypothetical protein [Roseovarius rhodophyticola]|uniref:Plant Basic Secretory Protein n=1 Tax=Roseovarius rhodophyticola TaxID=3080827 RepID=A0ABZ2TI37_9RHOB|nr:hypothetical protein [Roseovarius sp. W115]MDV2929707.1 hypothetical protein [Roseovarius sp. W115]